MLARDAFSSISALEGNFCALLISTLHLPKMHEEKSANAICRNGKGMYGCKGRGKRENAEYS